MLTYVERIRSARIANGMVRIETAATGSDGEDYKTGELAVPPAMFRDVLQQLGNAGQELDQKVRERLQQAQEQANEQGEHQTAEGANGADGEARVE